MLDADQKGTQRCLRNYFQVKNILRFSAFYANHLSLPLFFRRHVHLLWQCLCSPYGDRRNQCNNFHSFPPPPIPNLNACNTDKLACWKNIHVKNQNIHCGMGKGEKKRMQNMSIELVFIHICIGNFSPLSFAHGP